MRRTPHAALLGLLALVAGSVLLAACATAGGGAAPAPTATRAPLPGGPTTLRQYTPAQFRSLLERLRGRPLVLNVWASWCGPCMAEAPALGRVARAEAGRVAFLGLDVADQAGPARAFIRRYRWPFPSVFDPNRTIQNALGVSGQPVTIVFDARGRVAFGPWSGPLPAGVLAAHLRKLTSAPA